MQLWHKITKQNLFFCWHVCKSKTLLHWGIRFHSYVGRGRSRGFWKALDPDLFGAQDRDLERAHEPFMEEQKAPQCPKNDLILHLNNQIIG